LLCRIKYFIQNGDSIPTTGPDVLKNAGQDLILEGERNLESHENTMRSIRQHEDTSEYRKSQLLKAQNKDTIVLSTLNKSLNNNETIKIDDNTNHIKHQFSQLSLTECEKLAFNAMNKSQKDVNLHDVKPEEILHIEDSPIIHAKANELDSLLNKFNESGQIVGTIEHVESLSDLEESEIKIPQKPIQIQPENNAKNKQLDEYRQKLHKKLQLVNKPNNNNIPYNLKNTQNNEHENSEITNKKSIKITKESPSPLLKRLENRNSEIVKQNLNQNVSKKPQSPIFSKLKNRFLTNNTESKRPSIVIKRSRTPTDKIQNSNNIGSAQIIRSHLKEHRKLRLENVSHPKQYNDSQDSSSLIDIPTNSILINKNYGEQHHQVNVQINVMDSATIRNKRKNIMGPCLKLAQDFIKETSQTPTVKRYKNSVPNAENRACSQIGRPKNIFYAKTRYIPRKLVTEQKEYEESMEINRKKTNSVMPKERKKLIRIGDNRRYKHQQEIERQSISFD